MKHANMCIAVLALSIIFALPAREALARGGGPNGGGYGACPGMTEGYRMGLGMMGGHDAGMGSYGSLNLNAEQKAQVARIKEQLRKQHWDLMGQMREESIKLRTMMSQENPEPAAAGKQQMRVADIHRQMLEARIDAQNRINALLTPEQRAQLRNYAPDPGLMMED